VTPAPPADLPRRRCQGLGSAGVREQRAACAGAAWGSGRGRISSSSPRVETEELRLKILDLSLGGGEVGAGLSGGGGGGAGRGNLGDLIALRGVGVSATRKVCRYGRSMRGNPPFLLSLSPPFTRAAPRTFRTHRVPRPVLTGHAASPASYELDTPRLPIPQRAANLSTRESVTNLPEKQMGSKCRRGGVQ